MNEATDNSNAIHPHRPVCSRRLWFGFVGAAIAFHLAGALNVFLAWQACMGGEAGSFVFTQTGVRILLGVITFALLATGIASGLISYRNWRALSQEPEFAEAEGRGRKEYMAIFGVVVAGTLSMGMVWFAIPIYMIGICVRAY